MATSNNSEIDLSYLNVATMQRGIQIKANARNSFYSTSAPINKVISSIAITAGKSNSNLYVSVDGIAWSNAITISSTTTKIYSIDENYKYFKIGATTSYAHISSVVVTYESASASVAPDSIAVDSISIKTKEKAKINVTFTSNSGKSVTETGLKYEIEKEEDKSIISVDDKGYVTGLKAGTAQITVSSTAVDNVTAICNVTVIEDLSTKGVWTKVTDVSDLKVGDMIIITNGEDKALSIDGENNRSETTITLNGDNVEIDSSVQKIVLEEGKTSGSYAFNVNNGYLYASSSNSNYLQLENTLSNNSSWSISLGTNGAASIVAQGNFTRKNLRYNENNGNGLFSCYKSGQKDVYIYKGVDSA